MSQKSPEKKSRMIQSVTVKNKYKAVNEKHILKKANLSGLSN